MGLVRQIKKQKWPSGLRRQIQALFRKGVGSNPTFCIFYSYPSSIIPHISDLSFLNQSTSQHKSCISAFLVEVSSVLVAESMVGFLVDSQYQTLYLTSIGYPPFSQSFFNFRADSLSENPLRGSRAPKWAIVLALILSSLKMLRSGMPQKIPPAFHP